MATMNISLPDPMKSWVEQQTLRGLYGNSSDYVRDLIRRDQQRMQAVTSLQAAITEAVASGDPTPFDSTAFKHRMRKGNGAG